ncbi:MAG: copper-binding protein [Burkholderiales bacterium]
MTLSIAAPLAPSVGAEPGIAEVRPAPLRVDWLADGVVRAIDRRAGKIVLRHGPIENLGIPPMTMIFRVRDIRSLDPLEAGAAVRFAADRADGVFTITHIELR